MPVILPSNDNSYTLYGRDVGNVTDEVNEEIKRLRERHAAQLEQLEKNHNEAMRKKEMDASNAVDKAKTSAQDDLSAERRKTQSEINELKRNTYDRNGKFAADTTSLKKEFENKINDFETDKEHQSRIQSENERYYEDRIGDIERARAREKEDAIEKTGSSIREAYATNSDANKESIVLERERLAQKYREMMEQTARDSAFDKRITSRALQEKQSDFDNQKMEEGRSQFDRNVAKSEALAKSVYHDTVTMRDAHEREMAALRAQIGSLDEMKRSYEKEHSDGAGDAQKEMARDWRVRAQRVQDSFDTEIHEEKSRDSFAQSAEGERHRRALQEQGLRYADILRNENLQHRKELGEAETTFINNRKQLETRNAADRKLASESLEKQLGYANNEREHALREQAKAYQNTIMRNHESAKEKISQLESDRAQKFASSDISNIPPAAEAQLRQTFNEQYEGQFQTERNRNKETIDSIQREYSARMRAGIANAQKLEAGNIRSVQTDANYEKSQLMGHLADVQYTNQNTLRDANIRREREGDVMRRDFAEMAERQRRGYEELLIAAKYESENKINALRQESEFNSRMSQRAFAQKQNEIIRDYEKKLSDQKSDYVALMNEIKAQDDSRARETDRKYRAEMENQARAYEQRIAQIESQFTERERMASANHTEEMDKLKRSYALSQKKG